MDYAKLGSGQYISRLCFGCEPLGGTDWGDVDLGAIENSISLAQDLGVNFFDTADVYGLGLSERRLAKALGAKRHDVVIATKGGVRWERSSDGMRVKTNKDLSPKYLREAVSDSLHRLQIDCIPLYYAHWPTSDINDIPYAFELLQKLRDEQKILNIGCSNFNLEELKAAMQVAVIDVLQLSHNYLTGLTKEKNDLLDFASGNGICVAAYNALGGGLLSGKYKKGHRFSENDRRSRYSLFDGEFKDFDQVIAQENEIALKRGLTLPQYALERLMLDDRITSLITGVKSAAQLKENIQVFNR